MTTWAYSPDGANVELVRRRVRDLPNRRLDGGAIVLGLHSGSKPGLLADCGIFPVQETPRPSDQNWQWIPSHTIVDGVAVQSWERGDNIAAERAERAAERAERAARADMRTVYRSQVAELRRLQGSAKDSEVGLVAGVLADLIEAEHPE